MRTYEFTVSRDSTAVDGMVSVDSLCGFILNAAYRTIMDEGYPGCMLSRCSIEIDERPKSGETINIMVDSGYNNIVTLLNRCVSITDNEGIEIGRGDITWLMPDSIEKGDIAENPSRMARRFIKRFRSALPDINHLSSLQLRLDMDFSKDARENNDFTVDYKKICDSRFFFLARSGASTICRAMLQAG